MGTNLNRLLCAPVVVWMTRERLKDLPSDDFLVTGSISGIPFIDMKVILTISTRIATVEFDYRNTISRQEAGDTIAADDVLVSHDYWYDRNDELCSQATVVALIPNHLRGMFTCDGDGTPFFIVFEIPNPYGTNDSETVPKLNVAGRSASR